jgi:peptide/nickel transport system substrate-binding protein
LLTRRGLLRQIVLVAGGALLAACSAPAPSAPTVAPGVTGPSGATRVVFGAANEPGGFNPLLPDTGSSGASWEVLYESLVSPDPKTGAPSPGLAERWEASADGVTWTFHLRSGVKWSDGQPFTSDDVAFTFDAIADPKTGSPRRASLANIAGYAEPDPATFRVTLKQPDCPFLSTTMLTPIVPRQALAGAGDMKTDDFNVSRPVGTGPYKFKEWKRGEQVTLAANPTYWGGRPKIDEWIQRPITNKQVLAAQLKLGEVDYGSVTPDAVDELAAQPNLATAAVSNPTAISVIMYNLDRPLFQDKRVRQALTHALDRQAMVDTLLYGQGEVLNSPIAPVSWASNPNVPAFKYDPDAARSLLAQAGWQMGPSGLLEKDGTPFSFTLTCNNANPQRLSVVTIAQDAWRKLGIQVVPDILDGAAVRAKYQQTREFDAIIEGGPLGLTNDPDQIVLWSSAGISAGTNFTHYSNPRVDQLLEQARSSPGCGEADRKPFYDQFQQVIADEQPFTFLYTARTTVVYNKRLRGVSPSPWLGTAPYVSWGIKSWTLAN